MPLRILLAQAELELVPEEIAGHPAVRKHAAMQDKRPSRILLDQNAHGPAARKLPEGTRRGRPDIVHYSLLTLLESPLAKSGGLEVAVHTRDGTLVRIRNDTRLPRGELRFHGLLAKVLVEGASHDKDPLLWVEGRLGPEEVLATFAAGPVLRLDEGGSPLEPTAIAARAQAGELTLIVGAYPEGAWSDAWVAAVPEAVSIWPEPLNAWAVVAELVAGYRARWPAQPAPPGPSAKPTRPT